MMLSRSRSQTVTAIGTSDDEGFVWKKGKWIGGWKKRYFIRKDNTLFSFEADEKTQKPIFSSRTTFELEFWRLEKTNEKKDEKHPHMCRLTNTNTKNSYLVAMNTEQDLKKWLLCINRTRVMIKYKNFIPQVIKIQKQIRMQNCRMPYKQVRNASLAIQSYYKLQIQKAKYKQAKKRIVKCQSVVRRFLAVRAYKRFQRRRRIVSEMVTTEINYVCNLRTVLELFANPLKAASHSPFTQILSQEEIKVLFGPVEPVFQVNSDFCAILDNCLKSWGLEQTIGEHFSKIADKFKFVYVPYVLNYGEVCVILEKIRKKNPKFNDFLEAAKEDTRSRGLDIMSFLIQPVQRLPRYELLLKDLIKHTPKNHVDYEDLNKGLQRINDVAVFINEKKRDKENISLVTNLQTMLEGKIAENIPWKPHHRLLREGEGQSATGRKVNYIFLLNEFIILTQKQKTTHHVKEIIWLRETEVNVVKNETTEQINFQKNGEKAGVIVPLAKNPWSDDVFLLVVSYQNKLNSSSDATTPLSLLSSPPTSPVSSRSILSSLSSLSSSSALSPSLTPTPTSPPPLSSSSALSPKNSGSALKLSLPSFPRSRSEKTIG